MTIFRVFSLCLALICNAAWADTPIRNAATLTEDESIALFFQRNLGLIAAKFNVDQSRAEEIIAAAIPNPVFSFWLVELSNQWKVSNQNTRSLPGYTIMIQQLIETAGKRGLRMEGAELGTEAAELELMDVIRVLSNAVRHAFYGLLLAQKNLDVAKDNLARYQRILEANQIRLEAGDISEIDYTRIEVENLKAQGELDRTETALKQARTELLLLLGWPENSLTLTAAEAWPKSNLKDDLYREDALTRKALATRPDFRAAKVRIDQAGKNLELARRLVYPDVTVTAAYAKDPGNYFTNTGQLALSMPLPIFYRQEGEIAKAGVALNNAEINLRQTEQNVKADVVKALSAWKSADAIAKRFEQSVLERIEKLRVAQEFAYQKGATGLLDLIDAERSYRAMMLDYYTALANRSNAWADLVMALGEEVK